MSPRIPIAASPGARRLTWAETRIRTIQKEGPGPWIYVGDYPTDDFTTYWSPPWENSFTFVVGHRVAFRHGVDGLLEFKGQFDLTAGAVTGDVAFTLPSDWRGDQLDFLIPLELSATEFNMVRVVVDADTGEVTLHWPVTVA